MPAADAELGAWTRRRRREAAAARGAAADSVAVFLAAAAWEAAPVALVASAAWEAAPADPAASAEQEAAPVDPAALAEQAEGQVSAAQAALAAGPTASAEQAALAAGPTASAEQAGELGRGAGNFGGAGGFAGASGNRFGSPDRNQLNSFLGLPSDGGLGGVAANPRAGAAQLPAGGNRFDVNYGSAEGPRGGQAGGVAVTGPRGNTAGRAVGVGAEGGVAAAGGVRGADGGAAARGAAVGPGGGVAAGGAVRGPDGGGAARGAAVGPGGRVAAGGAVRGPNGGVAARGVAAGPGGVAAGFARVSPSGRYTAAVGVRSSYRHYGVYRGGWYARYPGAWIATGLAAGAVWNAATWGSAAGYCGYSDSAPVYYDYGNNVTYEDNSVYVNGDNVGTSQEYYDQAAELAAQAPPPTPRPTAIGCPWASSLWASRIKTNPISASSSPSTSKASFAATIPITQPIRTRSSKAPWTSRPNECHSPLATTPRTSWRPVFTT